MKESFAPRPDKRTYDPARAKAALEELDDQILDASPEEAAPLVAERKTRSYPPTHPRTKPEQFDYEGLEQPAILRLADQAMREAMEGAPLDEADASEFYRRQLHAIVPAEDTGDTGQPPDTGDTGEPPQTPADVLEDMRAEGGTLFDPEWRDRLQQAVDHYGQDSIDDILEDGERNSQ